MNIKKPGYEQRFGFEDKKVQPGIKILFGKYNVRSLKEMELQKQVFNIEVPIPSDMVLISRSEYLDLIQKEEVGQWWTIDKVEELLSISKTKLVNDILLNPSIKKEVDIEQNEEGFVLYPKSKGSPYRFLARKTREYFDKNYQKISLML